jgi:hypothetical protein
MLTLLRDGNALGPVHRSTEPVEMLPHVQKLYKTGHVATSQRVQCYVHWTQAFPLRDMGFSGRTWNIKYLVSSLTSLVFIDGMFFKK